MELQNLQDLLVEELKDLYSAEKQILRSLPKVAKKVENEELRTALEEHVEQTQEHVNRLEKVLQGLGESTRGKKCKGMEGLIEENDELLSEDADPEVKDAGLIVGLQKVEHYEIAGYGSVVTFAKLLGNKQAADLLAKTLDEEEKTDKKLTAIAKKAVNVRASR